MPLSLLMATLMTVVASDDVFQQNVRTTNPKSAVDQLHSFQVPAGFEIQLVAAEPDIQKPMNLAFDARGRLWVSCSVEYPFVAAEGEGRDTIRILEDTDDDGRADKILTFAEGLNIPMGLYPYGDGVIAYSIPHIYYLRDTDGDGKCDRRDILVGSLGTPRDTHGMQNAFRRGFDGWLYVNHGFANTSTIRPADGPPITLNSGNTYRLSVDGSRAEQFTWGQVNPFGSAFTPAGDLITADCHSKPLTMLIRGGYYPSFGKPHNGLGFAPDLMQHQHGSTGIAGVAYCAHQQFPSEYHGNLFVGNVVTSRIHRDRLEYRGASPRAVAKPDFVTTDDPWFRPVDLRMGPDGALYIADFYNRIIGHYEVPLEHPGRDRERGRIWRVRYKGKPPTPVSPLDQGGIRQLVRALGHPNLTMRMLAMDQLSDRIGQAAIEPLRAALQPTENTHRLIHAAWTLFRLGGLNDDDVAGMVTHHDPRVRQHAMRIIAETSSLSTTVQQQLLHCLEDPNPHVRRSAAEAIGRHPQIEAVPRLLNQLMRTPAEDEYLRHTIRIAIRAQLRLNPSQSRLDLAANRAQQRTLADIAVSIPSVDASRLVFSYLHEGLRSSDDLRSEYLEHVARHLPAEHGDDLARLVQAHVSDIQRQSELFMVFRSAIARVHVVSKVVENWGRRLATALIESTKIQGWRVSSGDVRWEFEQRNSSDGRRVVFLSSLPGGEQATGVLRSSSFRIPTRLSFDLCGHRGLPGTPASDRNRVVLRLLGDEQIIKTAYPPRHDDAMRVEWDLSRWEGRQAVVEIVDGMDETAYAWLAVSRFDPAVITLPTISPAKVAERQALAAQLAEDLQLRGLEPALTEFLLKNSSWQVRASAASALLELRQQVQGRALLPILTQPDVNRAARDEICREIANPQGDGLLDLTRELFRALPLRHQITIASQMASNPQEGELLLDLIRQGLASPRLLQVAIVRDKLRAVLDERGANEIDRISSSLPPIDASIQNLFSERIRYFRESTGSIATGHLVFKKHCQACHQVAGEGSMVGPQLDGIGTRGLERVVEDVVVPQRNVDAAFSTSILTLNDGRVVSGLLRRTPGESVFVIDSQGKALEIRKSEIEQIDRSPASIMPSNFAEVMSREALNDLFTYLMSLTTESTQ